ncbi:hypothetical protein JCM33374_g243 [Metschnikowia sp. JCM 33374]|nr:hypothetical protein JCM33374_g243 [Metschnikowia sp. JCM 33374]
MLRSFTRSAALARKFSSRAALLNASIFRMPAMSPTMTEGGIVSWKFKAGEEFASGDVLLEVETDKATIDVEATDDGIMWEVLLQDGESGIPVGKPIALLAEPGDDLSSLEKPSLEEQASKPAEPKKEDAPKKAKEEKATESNASRGASKASSEIIGKANPALKVTPAVEILLHRNGISNEEAFSKIPASGPKGRLLKGDVLAYLGEIESSAVSKVAEYIKNKEHLDLSNIKVAPPQKAAEASKEAPKEASPAAVEKPKPKNILTIEFTSELGEGVSKEKFKFAFERALESAKRHTYGSRFPNYARSPIASGTHQEDLFDDLLVASVSQDRFEVKNISYKFIGGNGIKPVAASVDPFDDLLGLTSAPSSSFVEVSDSLSAVVSFQIKFDAKLSDSKDFVEFFQESLLSQIPSKQLIIQQ